MSPSTRRAGRALASVRLLVAVTLGVMAVDVLARDHLWRYEWRWATYQYHFGTILLVPVVAGVAAWDGRRQAQAGWLVAPAGRSMAVWAPLHWRIGAVWLGYVLGWLIPAAIVLRSGTADALTADALATFGPALAVLAAGVAVGSAAGVRWPVVVAPPVVAIVVFGALLLGWGLGAEALVRVGGSGTSMATFEPVPAVQAGQVTCWLLVATAAGGVATLRLLRRGPWPWPVWVAVAGAVAVAVWLCVGAGSAVRDRSTTLACRRSEGHRYCAFPAYRSRLALAVERVRPGVLRLERAGVAVPTTIRLGAGPVRFFEDLRPEDVLGELEAIVTRSLDLADCPAMSGADPDESRVLTIWLPLVAGVDPDPTFDWRTDDTVPAVLRVGTDVEQDAWAARALARLRERCAR